MALSKDPNKRKRQLQNLQLGMAKKGDVLNPKGRPRKTIAALMTEFEASGVVAPTPDEIGKVFLYIATLKEEELKNIVSDTELPMMMRIVAKGVLAKKGLDVVERIVDRAYGKERRIDITTNGKDLRPEPLIIRFVASREDIEKIEQEVPDITTD